MFKSFCRWLASLFSPVKINPDKVDRYIQYQKNQQYLSEAKTVVRMKELADQASERVRKDRAKVANKSIDRGNTSSYNSSRTTQSNYNSSSRSNDDSSYYTSAALTGWMSYSDSSSSSSSDSCSSSSSSGSSSCD